MCQVEKEMERVCGDRRGAAPKVAVSPTPGHAQRRMSSRCPVTKFRIFYRFLPGERGKGNKRKKVGGQNERKREREKQRQRQRDKDGGSGGERKN